MNVQFTSSSRSLTKLRWTLTPGSPPSFSLPLGVSPTLFFARPDCESTKICSYHTFALQVKIKVPEPFGAISDGYTFSFLPTPCWKKSQKLSMAWLLRGTPKLGPALNPMKRKCEKNKIKLQNKMGKWDTPTFKTTPVLASYSASNLRASCTSHKGCITSTAVPCSALLQPHWFPV